ncbi:hypothetical protein JCM11491_001386, partial [Sporobolomyces phaffii]
MPVTTRAVLRPLALRHALDRSLARRSFGSSPRLGLPRSPRPTPTPSTLQVPSDIVSHKLQTIPFQLPPAKALDISYTAAASTFGVSVVLAHLVSRFCKKWFGFSPALLDAGIVEKAFRMVLLPVWKVDLVMRGKALLQDTELDLNSTPTVSRTLLDRTLLTRPLSFSAARSSVSALDSSLPGFRLSPLDELPLAAPFSPELSLPFSPSAHLTQHDTSVTVLPFTHHPLALLSKIAALPRTIEQTDGIGLTPRNFKEVLFATYPIYMPVYLGEFELRNDPEGKKVTTVQFGTSETPAFSVYPQFLNPPQWLPQSDSISLSISGRPSHLPSSSAPSASGASAGPSSLLKQLEPRLTSLLGKLQEKRRDGNEEGLITDRIEPGVEMGDLVEGHDRVMGFSEWI